MRKVALLLSLIMVFGLAACDNVKITFSDDDKDQVAMQTGQNQDNETVVDEVESTPQKSESQIISDNTVTPEKTNSETNNTTSNKKNSQNVSKIDKTSSVQNVSAANAKSIALKHAGVTATDIFDFDIEADYENGKQVWEINFEDKKYDYEYIIDIQTGKILHSEKEIDY